jgi:hydrogenase maturation protein HypF
MLERRLIAVEGVVQGVGFRPHVFGLATRFALRGFVRNDASGVLIDVEGDHQALDEFIETLTATAPPLASIERVGLRTAPPSYPADFSIIRSDGARAAEGAAAAIASDAASCDACMSEVGDAGSRRYRYPFTTCTACGPRLTIARGVPYDRASTTMAAFPLCAACSAEYHDPGDRRFHAEALACPECGPRLEWRAAAESVEQTDAALAACVAALQAGAVVAIRGLGGFHLACDARSERAVATLRRRKGRAAKPFALMVPDLETARALCHVDATEAALLGSVARPIVLLTRRARGSSDATALPDRMYDIAPSVAPGMPTLGLMLPYTPLHHMLLQQTGVLVMTSGNESDEPIVTTNDAALHVLAPLADGFLLHDRDIATRCDDSVAAVVAGAPTLLRRARGYAPRPLMLPVPAPCPLVALGGHLKNTFCLVRGRSAFVSQHIGDLGTLAAYEALRHGIEHYAAMFDAAPRVAAHDLHPDYASTRLAAELEVERRIPVQHHHAHVASCLAEHGVVEPVIGVTFDGTGLGVDGAIWGGEFLFVHGASCERLGHLAYMPLPGGDAAVRHPWRTAAAYLHAAFGGLDGLEDLPPLRGREPQQLSLLRQLLDRAGGAGESQWHAALAPPTSSAGRLFDAVAAVAGVRQDVHFEAQAAMELEALAGATPAPPYAVDMSDRPEGFIAEVAPVMVGVVRDVRAGISAHRIAARFHSTLRDLIVQGALRARARTGVRSVALTGGAFQNRRLCAEAAAGLTSAGFEVLLHRRVPCNDGGLSLGQAHIATLLAESA